MKRLLCVIISMILAVSLIQIPASAASLKLDRSSVDIPVDYYTTLKVTGAKGTVKWSSENSRIASVEPVDEKSADIIGKKTGTATIYAKVDGKTLKCTVNVKEALISVSSDHIELGFEDKKTVSVSVLGSKKLSVRNFNKNVCSLSWGEWDGNTIDVDITAKKDGTDEIDFYIKDHFDTTAVPVSVDADSSGTLLTEKDVHSEDNGEPDEWEGVLPLSSRKRKSENAEYKAACLEMQQIIADYDHSCEILLYSPEYGELFSHNTLEYVPGASTIKLAYAYYCCTQIEQGRHSLSETLAYEEKHYYGSSGVIQFYEYGTEWNVATLLDYMLRYSDNVAYFMLLDIFGEDGFNEMLREWGYGSIQLGERTFPDLNAEFLKTSMLKMKEKSSDGQCWKLAWNALLQSERIEIRKEISGVDLAVKFGSTYGHYHEVCYIGGDMPHVLVIMTGVEGKTRSEAFIRRVAVCAERIVQSQKYG